MNKETKVSRTNGQMKKETKEQTKQMYKQNKFTKKPWSKLNNAQIKQKTRLKRLSKLNRYR